MGNCAGQAAGLKGEAGEDGTVGYECCCKQELWKETVAKVPSPEEEMEAAPLSEEGYQAVAVHKDDEAMLKSVRRQLDIEPTADEKKAAEEKKRREEYWHKMKAANAAEKNAAGDNKAVE